MRLSVLAVICLASVVKGEDPCSLSEQLFDAASNNKLERVKDLLAQNANASCVDNLGRTPLMAAIDNNHAEVVRVLAGVTNLRIKGNDGRNASQIVVDGNNVELQAAIFKALHPFQAFIQDHWLEEVALAVALLYVGMTHIVIRWPRPEPEGWTALMFAAKSGNLELASRLLDAGANPLQATLGGTSAMSVAKERGTTEMCDLLKGWLPEPDHADHAADDARLEGCLPLEPASS